MSWNRSFSFRDHRNLKQITARLRAKIGDDILCSYIDSSAKITNSNKQKHSQEPHVGGNSFNSSSDKHTPKLVTQMNKNDGMFSFSMWHLWGVELEEEEKIGSPFRKTKMLVENQLVPVVSALPGNISTVTLKDVCCTQLKLVVKARKCHTCRC